MGKRIVAAIIAIMLVLVSVQGNEAIAASEEGYTIISSNTAPIVGEEFSVIVHGAKLDDLYGYEVKVNYSPANLQFIRATNLIGDGFSIAPIVKEGLITFAFTKIGASTKGLSGSSDIVRLTFKTINKGTSDVKLVSMKTANSSGEAQEYSLSAAVSITSLLKVSFSDVREKDWAYTAIMRAAGIGIVNGYQDGTFRPQNTITRAEFVTMLSRAFELKALADGSSLEFHDASLIGAWAKPHVINAVELGWIKGYEDGTFRPNQMINRTEMAAIAVRALELDIENTAELAFTDADQIAEWARPYIARASETGLINGRDNNRFVPEANATRVEAVSIILRAFDLKVQQ